MLPYLFINVVGSMRFRDAHQGLGPGRRSPLAWGEQRRLVPGIEQEKPDRAFTMLERRATVHMQAEGADVDLRRPHLDEREQLWIEIVMHPALDATHGLDALVRSCEIDPECHSALSLGRSMTHRRSWTQCCDTRGKY